MWGRSWPDIRASNIAVETLLFSCSPLGYHQRYKPFQVTLMSRMGECDAQMFQIRNRVLIPKATSGKGSAPRAKEQGSQLTVGKTEYLK